MRRIIVLNPKGGCGKTTIATNVAASFAACGRTTTVLDYDPQRSSYHWVQTRAAHLPRIAAVPMFEANQPPLWGAWQLKVPRDTERLVVDTQAGVRAADLMGRIMPTDTLLIPVQPSSIDIRATGDFMRELLTLGRVNPQERRIGIVANRARRNTHSFKALQQFLDGLNLPVIGYLRDSQNYLVAAEQGLGVNELTSAGARDERECWRRVLEWLEGMQPTAEMAKPAAAAPKPMLQPMDSPRIPSFIATSNDSKH